MPGAQGFLMKRTIRIHHNDGTPPIDLVLKSANVIRDSVGKPSLWLCRDSKSDQFHLTIGGGLIPDLSKVEKLEIVRED